MHIHAPTQTYPYTDADLRRDNPQVSFPAAITDAVRAEFGVQPVVATPRPTFDPLTQDCPEGAPVLVNGAWEQTWVVMPVSAEEIAARRQALQDEIITATQARLDDFARTRGYDGILSACTYATSSVPKFQAEGQYCVGARDATWSALYTMLAEVQAGTRPVPSGYADIEPELPPLVWPN